MPLSPVRAASDSCQTDPGAARSGRRCRTLVSTVHPGRSAFPLAEESGTSTESGESLFTRATSRTGGGVA